jgi:hypothetical protein
MRINLKKLLLSLFTQFTIELMLALVSLILAIYFIQYGSILNSISFLIINFYLIIVYLLVLLTGRLTRNKISFSLLERALPFLFNNFIISILIGLSSFFVVNSSLFNGSDRQLIFKESFEVLGLQANIIFMVIVSFIIRLFIVSFFEIARYLLIKFKK